MLVIVFVTGIFVTAVTPVLSDQRAAVLRQGGHVLSVFPVLCSGFFWADGCADSNYCEVSSDYFFLEFLSAVLVSLSLYRC